MSAVAGRPVVPDVDDVIVHLADGSLALRCPNWPDAPEGGWLVWPSAGGETLRRPHEWVQTHAVATEDRRGLSWWDTSPTPPERWTR